MYQSIKIKYTYELISERETRPYPSVVGVNPRFIVILKSAELIISQTIASIIRPRTAQKSLRLEVAHVGISDNTIHNLLSKPRVRVVMDIGQNTYTVDPIALS